MADEIIEVQKFELQEFNPTKNDLAEMAKKVQGVEVRSETTLMLAEETRKDLQQARLTITKIAKAMRDWANKYQKAVIAQEKDYLSIIVDSEKEIKEKIDAYKLQQEMEKRKEDLEPRKAELAKIGITDMTDDEILAMKDSKFEQFYKDKKIEYYEEQEAKRQVEEHRKQQEAEKKKREEEIARKAKEEAEQEAKRKAEEEKARIQKEADDKLKAEQEAREEEKRKQQAEIDRLEREKLEKEKAEKEAEEKKIAEEKARKAEERKAKKNEKYQAWLKDNNFDKKTDKVERAGENKFVIYRAVSEIVID